MDDALLEALRVWPDQPPRDPKGWLVTVAWRRFLDGVGAETSRQRRELLADQPASPEPAEAADDTLELYLLCAPSLPRYTAVAAYLHERDGDRETAARSTPKGRDRRPTSPSATTSRARPRGSTRSCAVEPCGAQSAVGAASPRS